jgi:hypothetical protein
MFRPPTQQDMEENWSLANDILAYILISCLKDLRVKPRYSISDIRG